MVFLRELDPVHDNGARRTRLMLMLLSNQGSLDIVIYTLKSQTSVTGIIKEKLGDWRLK
jgi:hypothetical protein